MVANSLLASWNFIVSKIANGAFTIVMVVWSGLRVGYIIIGVGGD